MARLSVGSEGGSEREAESTPAPVSAPAPVSDPDASETSTVPDPGCPQTVGMDEDSVVSALHEAAKRAVEVADLVGKKSKVQKTCGNSREQDQRQQQAQEEQIRQPAQEEPTRRQALRCCRTCCCVYFCCASCPCVLLLCLLLCLLLPC